MSGLLDLLSSSTGQQLVSGVASQTGQPESKTAEVLAMALPLIMGAMKKNASSPSGAQSLMSALNTNHDGSQWDNIGQVFSGGVNDSLKKDGAGILGHVFGNKQSTVENALSKQSGMDTSTIAEILKIAAPLLMAYLAKNKKQSKINDANGLSGLLGQLLGGQSTKNQSLITTLLDADGDGSVLDDVAGMVLGSKKKKGGLGGLMGGLFKK